jgi:hypothetical protein
LKRITTYLFIAMATIIAFTSCTQHSELPSLQETFSAKDKNPFGAYVFHNQLQQLYPRNTVKTIRQHFSKTWDEISDSGSLYINISRNFILTKDDRNAILNYVYAGNSIFISSEYIDTGLLNFLHCTENWAGHGSFIYDLDYTTERSDSAIFSYSNNNSYNYYYLPFNNYFTYDSGYATVVGRNENFQPDYIIMYYGRGRLYLHCEPRAFSNYFLLQKENYHYLQNAFSLTSDNPTHVFWDDFYNHHNVRLSDGSEKSSLGFLLQFPPMQWAFWLSLLLLLLFILVGGKRRQRIIKVIPPNTNTTTAFAETIGRLYYQKKENRNIADKMITYFFEHIRNKYFLNTSQLNDDFITSLSRKSSVAKDNVEVLFATIASVQQNEKISSQQLLLLNKQIENFYKNKI